MSEDYKLLCKELENLRSNTEYFVFGYSELNEPLYAFVLGNKDSTKSILVQGTIHAREYINSFVLIEIIKYLKTLSLPHKVVIVPLLNPDGVRICLEGCEFIKNESYKDLAKNILKTFPQKMYKANARGVDLNTNFDANWGRGKSNIKLAPAGENFIGFKPNSESEVLALINLTKTLAPKITLSYHSKGNVIYYGYAGQLENTLKDQTKFLNIIKKSTGYTGIYTMDSAGGYKDYCLLKLGILGYTIETGADYLTHPIGLESLEEIFKSNKNLILDILKEL